MRLLAALLVLPLAACGAGVIGGVFASNRSRTAPEVRVTSVTINDATAKFASLEFETRQLFIANYAPGANAPFRVTLRAALAPDAPPSFPIEQLIVTRGGSSSGLINLQFVLSTAGLLDELARLGVSPSAGDFPAVIEVSVEGVPIAPAVPIVIPRRPTATLVPSQPGASEEFVSVAGGDRVNLRLSGSRAAEAASLKLYVGTLNPLRGGEALPPQLATDLRVTPIPESSDLLVSGVMPVGAFPSPVILSVQDSEAGLSTLVTNVFYRPAGIEVVPRSVPTDGNVRVSLFGAGLLPLRFVVGQPGEPDYDQLEVYVERGGHRVQVPPAQIQRVPPSLTRLNFEVPASPDGRTGSADIRLRARIVASGVVAETFMPAAVTYGDTSPVFGARGATLTNEPAHFALADVERPGGGHDCVVTFGDVARAQFLVALDNGMLRRFGSPLLAGNVLDVRQRLPQRIAAADWTGDGAPDFLLLNRGDGQSATHNLLSGRPVPDMPLRTMGAVVGPTTTARRFVSVDINQDGKLDLVVVPAANSGLRPEMCLAGNDAQFEASILDIESGYEVVDAGDLDGDGFVDLLFGRGGIDPGIAIMYGVGDGRFPATQVIPLRDRIPDYQEDATSFAVGVHACGEQRRALALVLSGRPSAVTPPTLVLLLRSAPRSYLPPDSQTTSSYPGEYERWAVSLASDLDGDDVPELIISNRGESFEAVARVLFWTRTAGGARYREVVNSIDPGAAPLFGVSSLALGDARNASSTIARRALYVVHKQLGSDAQDRLSTFLIDASGERPRFDAADASRAAPFDIDGVALGRFTDATSGPLDVVVAGSGSAVTAAGIQFYANDGIGVLSPTLRLDVSCMGQTVASLATGRRATVVTLAQDRRLLVVPPSATGLVDLRTVDLSPYLPPALRTSLLEASSRIASGDVDRDGVDDAVILMVFPPGVVDLESSAQLLILLGRGQTPAGELPLLLPDPNEVRTVSAHGDARDVAVGDLAPEAATLPARAEVAVAVAGVGNHVRFYRLRQNGPNDYALVRSFASGSAPVLTAGDRPVRLALGDTDGNGTVDLAVAGGGDRQLALFANLSPPRTDGEVDVAAFRAIPFNSRQWDREPKSLQLVDVNGDGYLDLISVVDAPRTTVSFQLGTGSGVFADGITVPGERTGELVWIRETRDQFLRGSPGVLAAGDLNGDASLDLVLGWHFRVPFRQSDRNLRLLFGSAR